MNLQTKVLGVIAASTALMLVLAPLLITTASAKITESCTNRGGHVSAGPCNGNTDSNGKTCAARNPAGHEPGGHNPC
jgi:hypothetical protein